MVVLDGERGDANENEGLIICVCAYEFVRMRMRACVCVCTNLSHCVCVCGYTFHGAPKVCRAIDGGLINNFCASRLERSRLHRSESDFIAGLD